MALLLISLLLLHLITLVMLFIAIIEKEWWTLGKPVVENADLWHKCIYDNNTSTWLCTSAAENEWLQSVQALMVLSVVLSSISLLVFLGQLFVISKGGFFYLTGLCQTLSGVLVFAASLIFTFQKNEILQDSGKGFFGYCFILAWLCVPLLLSSGVFYVHLRIRT